MVSLLRIFLFVAISGASLVLAQPGDDWRDEFNRICGRTGEAGQMSEAELSQLITDSERLRERIAGSTDPDRKVYLFRIGKCRDFLQFMRDAAVAARP